MRGVPPSRIWCLHHSPRSRPLARRGKPFVRFGGVRTRAAQLSSRHMLSRRVAVHREGRALDSQSRAVRATSIAVSSPSNGGLLFRSEDSSGRLSLLFFLRNERARLSS